MVQRPDDLFDRQVEWDDLVDFVGGDDPIRIGIVYGRRRQGKSWLLRRTVRQAGGLYTMALQHDRQSALRRVAGSLASLSSLPGIRFELADWEEALRSARTVLDQAGQRVLVLDEYPYLLEHSPELSSVLQAFYDDVRNDRNGKPLRILLCGSAISVMEELLSGSSPLRGRTNLEMLLRPFDFRQAARYWRITDPELAFVVHAVLGGTAGYPDLVQIGPPASPSELPRWLAQTVLNPSSALFSEDAYLLREDPRIRDRAPYFAVLEAVSAGKSTPTAIGGAIGRDKSALAHPLDVLTTAGFLVHDDDVRKQRRPSIRIADPLVRFHQLITRPRLWQFEERRYEEAWAAAQQTFAAQILGPHFEHLCREWVRLFASADSTGEPVGGVGRTTVNDPRSRKTHELDVVALSAGERSQDRTARVAVIGEAKSSSSRRTIADLQRLEHLRRLLAAEGADCEQARLLLFGRSGFDHNLQSTAALRSDVELIDLDRLYRGS